MQRIGELQKRWDDEARWRGLRAGMSLAREGILLGARTVLAKRDQDGALTLDGERLLTLLAVAYGRPVDEVVLQKLERASHHAAGGDECLAAMEVALALPAVGDPVEAARRLFIAEGLLAEGVAPRDIWTALDFDPAPLDALAKFDPAQPRNPKGDGRASGEWTVAGALATAEAALGGFETAGARMAASAAAARVRAAVARMAARLPALAGDAWPALEPMALPAAVGAALLVPSSDTAVRVLTGPVRGHPGLSYSLAQDGIALDLKSASDGRTVATYEEVRPGVFTIPQTGAVAHLEDDELVMGPPAVAAPRSEARSETEEDKCPEPGPDLPGMIGRRGERSKGYENFMKILLNPENPTAPGFGYQLPNPVQAGKLVYYDDCEHVSGVMAEYKGHGYARLIRSGNPKMLATLAARWVRQATRQLDAGEGRPIMWFFAEEQARQFAERVFHAAADPRLRMIGLAYVRWPEGENWKRVRKMILDLMSRWRMHHEHGAFSRMQARRRDGEL